MSLSRLDCEEVSDDDSAQQSTPPMQQRQSPQRQPGIMIPRHSASLDAAAEKDLFGGSHSPEEDLSFSPIDSPGSSPTGTACQHKIIIIIIIIMIIIITIIIILRKHDNANNDDDNDTDQNHENNKYLIISEII